MRTRFAGQNSPFGCAHRRRSAVLTSASFVPFGLLLSGCSSTAAGRRKSRNAIGPARLASPARPARPESLPSSRTLPRGRTSPLPQSPVATRAGYPALQAPSRSSFPSRYQAVLPHPDAAGCDPWATASRNRPAGRRKPNPRRMLPPRPLDFAAEKRVQPAARVAPYFQPFNRTNRTKMRLVGGWISTGGAVGWHSAEGGPQRTCVAGVTGGAARRANRGRPGAQAAGPESRFVFAQPRPQPQRFRLSGLAGQAIRTHD
jgi:hypothetical protein